MNTNTNKILEWEAPSRPDYDRTHRWYLGGAVFCLLMVTYALLAGTWAMAVVFAFIPALYYLLRNQNHRKHKIRISELGISIDGRLRGWGEWSEFWILVGPGYHELHVSSAKRWAAELIMLTEPMDPYAVRDALAEYLTQTMQKKERILDAFIRFCKL